MRRRRVAFTSREVEKLIEIANDALVGSTFEERVRSIGDGLASVVPMTSFSTFVKTPEGPGHAVFKNHDPKDVIEYARNYLAHDPMGGGFAKATGIPDVLSDFLGGGGWGRDAYTSDFLPRLGIRHIMAVAHPMPGGAALSFAIQRAAAVRDRDFTTKEREALRLLSPHIARATFVALLRERVAQLTPTPLDSSAVAAIFDAKGDVVHGSAGALTVLKRLDKDLDSLVGEVRRLTGARVPVTVDRLVRTDHGLHRLQLSRTAGIGSDVLMLLEKITSGTAFYLDELARRTGLTPREKQVAALAIEGRGNRQIARMLGCTPQTVAQHLARAYAKTGVSNRTELTALVLGGGTANKR